MKAKRYIGPAIIVLGLGAAALCLHCTKVRKTPRARLATGRWAAGDQIRTPLKASAQVRRLGGVIHFSLRLCDADETEIRYLQLPGGRPDPPRITVYNAAGKKVYAGEMEYG